MSKQYPGGVISKTPVTPTSLSAPGIWTMNQQAAAQATNTWPFPRDPQFNYVTMLLHGDGSAGAVPTTGVGAGTSSTVTNFNADASTNNFNVTINGDARSDNFTPYQGDGYYSNYFDGSGDYLNTANNAALNVGSSTFTFECWFYNQHDTQTGGNAGIGLIASKSDYNGSNSNGWALYCYDAASLSTPTTKLTFFANGISYYVTTSAGAAPFNTWTHIAVVKSGTNLTVYSNGVSVLTSTSAPSTINDTTTGFYIGSTVSGTTWNGTYPLKGYVSNARLVKGTAVYTAAFTPPTTPLTAITNTSLLTCQSNRFIDNSTNAFTITANGDAKVAPAQPFTLSSSVATYGSGYFGSANYLSAASNAAFGFGTGDFTVEAWVYPNAAYTTYNYIWATGATGGLVVYVLGGVLYVRNYGNSDILASSVAPTLNAWTHVAVTRSGTTLRIFVNGVQTGTTTNSTNFATGSGLIGNDGSNLAPWYGYLSDVRVVKGTAVYTSAFTPPTTPLTAITNTSLLTTQYNGGGNNSGFKDSSQNNFAITRNGNTTQGTFTPYGSNWSNYFNGSSDYLTVASNAAFQFSTGDFTIELWFFMSSLTGGNQHLIDMRGASSSALAPLLYVTSGGVLYYYTAGANQITGATLSVGQWYHIALARSGTSTKLFVNGAQSGSTLSDSTNYIQSSVYVGRASDAAGGYVNGYESNVRLVKGTAVYTSAFTPSTTPLTAISGTSLLTCQSNRFIDNSANAFTVSPNGSPTVQRFSPFAPLTVYNPATNGGSAYFDGSGDGLFVADNPAIEPGSGNFSVECWVYFNSVNTDSTVISKRVNSTSYAPFEFVKESTGNLGVWMSSSGSSWDVISGGLVVAAKVGQWYHIVLARSGTTISYYVNGVRSGTTTSSATLFNNTGSFNIGSDTNGIYTYGYISDVRYLVGASAYDATQTTYTVPTAPLTAIANTAILVNTTNAGIFDNSGMNDLETVGNAAVSTTVKKYGAASMYFDGTGDRLYEPSNQNFNFGTGDFTIELWANPISQGGHGSGNNDCLVDFRAATGGGAYGTLYIYNSGASVNWYANTGVRITGGAISNSTWTHIAICRSSGNTRLFLNGVQSGSTYADSTNYLVAPIMIGEFNDGTGGGNFNGYIDDLRITKGYARYTANFTVPDQAFPNG